MILDLILAICIVITLAWLVVSLIAKRRQHAECIRLQSELDSKSASIKDLEERLTNECRNFDTEKDLLTERIDNLNNAADSVQKKLSEQITQLETRNNELLSTLEEKERCKGELLVKLQEADEQVGNLEKEVLRLDDVVSSKDEHVAQLESKQTELREEVLARDVRLRDSDARVNDLEEENGRLGGVLSAREEMIVQLNAREAALGEEILVLKTVAASKEEELNRLQAEIDTVTTREDEELKRLAQVETELVASKELVETLRSKNEVLEQQVADAEVEEQETTNADELEYTIGRLQKANEDLSQCRGELANKDVLLEIRGQRIETLQIELFQTKEELERLRVELEILKESFQCKVDDKKTLEEKEPDSGSEELTGRSEEVESVQKRNSETKNQQRGIKKGESGTSLTSSDPDDIATHSEKTTRISSDEALFRRPTHQYLTKQKTETGDTVVDLPLIQNENGLVQRSIIRVRDISKDNPVIIEANEFFKRNPGEISRVFRLLEVADKMDKNVFVCGACGKRVKIAKRDYGSHEILFFSHCNKQIDCAYQRDYFGLFGAGSRGELNEEEFERFKSVKSRVLNSLNTEISRKKGVTKVDENAIIRSNVPGMVWRRASIWARYGDKSIVFEFYTKHTLIRDVAGKDVFYKKNKQYVIWILGADEEFGYDYFRKHVAQNTIFDNHRNAFFIDSEALAACEERQELVLKCNYLDVDGKWYFRKETTGSNGVLVDLSQLRFDDDNYKPYVFESSRQCFIADKNNKDSLQQKVIITSIKTRPGRNLYCNNGKCGVVDADMRFIIPCEYDNIIPWTKEKYLVQKIDFWGIFDEKQGIVLDCRYRSISKLHSGSALVDAGNEAYHIGWNCIRIPDEKYILRNGWEKYRFGNKWGIADERGKDVLRCEYDEIGSFRGRLVGFINGACQKLVPQYKYMIRMNCLCVGSIDGYALFDIGGVKIRSNVKMSCEEGVYYSDKCICNIYYNSQNVMVNDFTEKNQNKQYNVALQEDGDFELNSIYVGQINRTKRMGNRVRYFVRFENGKQTYFTLGTIHAAGKEPCDFVVGVKVKLRKIGFDKNYDRTIWELI